MRESSLIPLILDHHWPCPSVPSAKEINTSKALTCFHLFRLGATEVPEPVRAALCYQEISANMFLKSFISQQQVFPLKRI